jgi:hypothetical protein
MKRLYSVMQLLAPAHLDKLIINQLLARTGLNLATEYTEKGLQQFQYNKIVLYILPLRPLCPLAKRFFVSARPI